MHFLLFVKIFVIDIIRKLLISEDFHNIKFHKNFTPFSMQYMKVRFRYQHMYMKTPTDSHDTVSESNHRAVDKIYGIFLSVAVVAVGLSFFIPVEFSVS